MTSCERVFNALRLFKNKTTTPEHVGYRVQERADSEPPDVSYATIRYFLERGIGMSRHRQP